MNIGKEFKTIRINAGITQKELAKATGISQQAISTYENNLKEPTITNCIKLADYYQISLDELVGRDFY